MPTTITSQNAAEIGANLTNLGIWSYGVGGKVKTAYQNFYEICMATLGNVNVVGSQTSRTTRQASGATGARRTRAARPTAIPASTATGTQRRRGRPPGSTNTGTTTRVRKAGNITDAVLTAVSSAGTPRQILMANPTLKGFRQNHIGIAISRNLKAGRIIERDGMLYNTTAERVAA